MNKIQRTVEIELTYDECLTLYKAEKLLEAMRKEISMIITPTYSTDKTEIEECVKIFDHITTRYNVHTKVEQREK